MLDPDDLWRAHAEAKRLGISVPMALLQLGLADEAQLVQFLARQYDVPAVDLRGREISPAVGCLIAKEVALRLRAIPIDRLGSVLIVAMADPSDRSAVEEVSRLVGLDIEVVVSAEPAIRAAIAAAH